MSSYPTTNAALSKCCDITHDQFLEAVRPLIDACHELEDYISRDAGSKEDALLQMAAPDLLAACEAMNRLGTAIWDMTSGDALIMGENIPRLNEALNLIGNAVRKAHGEPPLVDFDD